jgi:hypothetical protein
MPVEQLCYEDIGQRLNISPGAARALARRLHLPRVLDNGGRALIAIDFTEIAHRKRALPERPAEDRADIVALKERVATLVAELAVERERTAGVQAAFEREKDRADRLLDNHGQMVAAHDQAVIELQGVRVMLEGSLECERERSAGVQAALERERDRVDNLTAVHDAMIAELQSLRTLLESRVEAARPRPWWRRWRKSA